MLSRERGGMLFAMAYEASNGNGNGNGEYFETPKGNRLAIGHIAFRYDDSGQIGYFAANGDTPKDIIERISEGSFLVVRPPERILEPSLWDYWLAGSPPMDRIVRTEVDIPISRAGLNIGFSVFAYNDRAGWELDD